MIPLHEHYLLGDMLPLFRCTKADEAAKTRVGLLVSVCNPHPTSNGNIESFEVAVLTNDGDEANIIGKDVDIVSWWNRDCDFELGRIVRNEKMRLCDNNYLPRKIEFAIVRFNILEGLASDQFFVQPDFMIGSRPG